jgi:hypothetical protein
MRHIRADNCFPHLADPVRAQEILDGMLDLPWASILDNMVVRANPMIGTIIEQLGSSYYWTIHQSEWASDVMFRDATDLAASYPSLVNHAITNFNSHDVMRFLGKRLTAAYRGEVITHYKERREGVRVKHFVGRNSEKMYDRAHVVPHVHGAMPAALRFEATVNDPAMFSTRRRAQGDPKSRVAKRPLRKGIADMRRRARICQQANDRYANALAVVGSPTKVHDLITPLTKPAELNGRRVRPLRPWAEPDLSFLRAIGDGDFLLNGFRNKDLRAALFPQPPSSDDERRKQSARVSYILRILRAHGVVEKVEGTHRYHVTDRGREVIAAAINTDQADLTKLAACA